IREMGGDYRGIHFIAAVDETTYLSRIARVLAGDYRLGNAMIYEYRDDPFTYGPLPEYVLGTIGRLAGLSIATLDIAATFALPAVIFLLFFGLLRRLSGRDVVALVGALTLVLGHYLVAKDSPLLQLRLYHPGFPHSLQLVRPVSPQFHYLLFVGALWLVYWSWCEPGSRRRRALAGVGWGLTFYLNFFFWTFLATGIALGAALALLRRDRERVIAGIAVLTLGIAVGAYYWVNALRVMATPGFHDISLRAGFLYMRRPLVPAAHVVWLGVFLLWLRRHREHHGGWFLLPFLVGGLVCLNQQVLTGRTVQPFHWETQTNKVVMLLSAFVIVAAWRASRPRLTGRRIGIAAAAAAAALLIAHAALLQTNYYRANRAAIAGLQELGPALAWLRTSTPRDAVVVTNPEIPLRSELVTVYGQRFAILSEPFFMMSIIPLREIDARLTFAARVFGLGDDGFRRVLDHGNGSLFFGMYSLPYYHRGDDAVVRRHLDEVAERYRTRTAAAGATDVRFRVDYVLVGADERRALDLGALGAAREVYSDGRFAVLAVGG
ncbi:MAG: hypothetical protein HY216_05350, partial [Candidatus Rokubacteria bacterium]|nr:hypothetical protein [Candidatus Rokubacteria bacterium]